jgi:hypothetical protein
MSDGPSPSIPLFTRAHTLQIFTGQPTNIHTHQRIFNDVTRIYIYIYIYYHVIYYVNDVTRMVQVYEGVCIGCEGLDATSL